MVNTVVRSMTGFGRYEAEQARQKICVEIRSVNHRYLDLNIKLPRKFNALEFAVRALLKKEIARGKVDVYITHETLPEGNSPVRYHPDVAAVYKAFLDQMAKQFQIPNDVTVSKLSRYPEVFTVEEQGADSEELWEMLEQAVRGALASYNASREAEGANLQKDLLEKLSRMEGQLGILEEYEPRIIERYRAKLKEKIGELLDDTAVDENRLVMEVTLYADKVCVDEEMVRLRSHITMMAKALRGKDAVGRKLDFIAQEMNREANTILSKAGDIELSNVAIELKTLIEKVREQIQNIE